MTQQFLSRARSKNLLKTSCNVGLMLLSLFALQPLHAAPWAPEPVVANDTGNWSSSTFTELQIRLNGFRGYETTGENNQFAAKFHHPQHVVRLPNKVGADGQTRAYFAITQSNKFYSESLVEHVTDGYWLIAEIDAAAYDPATDQVIGTAQSDGRFVYEEHFNSNRDKARDEYRDRINAKGSQMVISLEGDWTHPAKMSAFDGILLLVGQNWSPSGGGVTSTPGDSLDAVLFYDVRDPAAPKYLGKLDSEQLNVNPHYDSEDRDDPDGMPYAGWRKIDSIGLSKSEDGIYHLGVMSKNFFCHQSKDCFINPTTPGKWVPEDVVYGTDGQPKGSFGMSGGQGGIFHSKEIYASVPAANEPCYDKEGKLYPAGAARPAECMPAGVRRTIWFEPAEDSVLPNPFTVACDVWGSGCNLGTQNRMGLPLFSTLRYDSAPDYSPGKTTLKASSHFAGKYTTGGTNRFTDQNGFVTQLFGDCGPGGGIQVSNQNEPLIYCVSESSSEPIGCPEGGKCNRLWQNAAGAAPGYGAIRFTSSTGQTVTYRGRGLSSITALSMPPWGPGIGKGFAWNTSQITRVDVLAGEWQIFDGVNFSVTSRTRGPGTYPWNSPVQSFRVVPDQGISLFEHANYFGRMVNTVRSNPALQHTCGDNAPICYSLKRDDGCDWGAFDGECTKPRTFHDKASSAIVKSNLWNLYVADGLNADEGLISNLGPTAGPAADGRVPRLSAYGDFNDEISSVRGLCPLPSKPLAVTATLLEPGRPLITWSTNINASSYEIQFDVAQGQAPQGGVWVPVTEVRYDAKYLPGATLQGGTYEFRVRGMSNCGGGAAGPYSDTLTLVIEQPPVPPVLFPVDLVSQDSAGLGSGTVTISQAPSSNIGGNRYTPGAVITLIATPADRSEFVGWSGTAASCGTSTSCDVVVPASGSPGVRAIFRPKPSLVIYTQGAGTVAVNPTGNACANLAEYTCFVYGTGSAVTMTPTAGANSVFEQWKGDEDCMDGSVSLSANRTCTAVFKNTSYKLTVGQKGEYLGPSPGSAIVSDPAGAINCGSQSDCEEVYPVSGGEQTLFLEASIYPGWVFVRWDGAKDCWNEDENDSNPLRVRVKVGTQNVHCSVVTVPEGTEYALTVEKLGGGYVTAVAVPEADSAGIDCLENACSQNYLVNTQVQLTATATRGAIFAGFDGDADCDDGQVSMVTNVTCIARFNSDVLVVNGANDDNSKEQNEYISVLRQMDVLDYVIWLVKNPNAGDNSTDPGTGLRRVEPVASDLAKFGRVIWYTDRSVYYTKTGGLPAGPTPAAEAALAGYLDAGGCLLLSSSQYYTDRGLTPFMQNYLGVSAVTPDVTESHVRGAGDPNLGFSNLVSEVGVNPPNPFRFQASGPQYRSDALLRNTGVPGSDVLFNYRDGSGAAAVAVDSGAYRAAYFGFPFLGLNSGNDRINVLSAFMDYCGRPERDDAYEVNDDFAAATDREGAVSLAGLKLMPGNDDYFRWTADSYGVVRFSIAFTHANGDLALEVYNSNEDLVASSNTQADVEEVVVSNVDAGDIFYVRVSGLNAKLTSYGLDIAAAGPPDRDHDGVPDTEDAAPDNALEQYDADGDSLGDNEDPDDDNDGLPDAWEILHGLNPFDPSDAFGDKDNDGALNRAEYLAETDPGNPGSKPPLVLPLVVGSPPFAGTINLLPSQYKVENGSVIGPYGTSSLGQFTTIQVDFTQGSFRFQAVITPQDLVDPDGTGPLVSPAVNLLNQISDLYVAYFNRAPDPAGLMYWFTEIYKGSLSLANTAKSFTDQPEYFLTYPPGLESREFIQLIYQNLFDREPDLAGWDYWENDLNNGLPRSTFILTIINGAYGGPSAEDKGLLNNKHRVSMYYSEQLTLNPAMRFDDNIQEVLNRVTADESTVATALNVIDFLVEYEAEIVEVRQDAGFWEGLWN